MKICVKCKSTNFYKSGDCKDCARAYRQKNKDKCCAATKLWREKNRENLKDYMASYRKKNAEAIREQRHDFYKNNADRLKESSRLWAVNNPQKVKQRNSRYRNENKEKITSCNLSWRSRNKEKDSSSRRIANHNYRARKKKCTGKLSSGLFEKLFNLQRGKCACCRRELSRTNPKSPMDHVIPLAIGGTNTDDNIQLLCKSCNSQKHTKHPIDFMQQKGFLL